MDKDQIVKAVYEMLTSQSFEDFYRGDFDDFILGEPNAKSKKEINEKIGDLLHL